MGVGNIRTVLVHTPKIWKGTEQEWTSRNFEGELLQFQVRTSAQPLVPSEARVEGTPPHIMFLSGKGGREKSWIN